MKWLILSTCVVACAACERPQKPTPPEPDPVEDLDFGAPNVLVDTAVDEPIAKARWRYPKLAQRGTKLGMSREDNGLYILAGEQQIHVGVVEFDGCIEELPRAPRPDLYPSAQEERVVVWASLRGGGDEAALMFSTTSVFLLVDDGCARAADVTPRLLGHRDDADDPVFTADGLVGEAARPAEALAWTRDGVFDGGGEFDRRHSAEAWRDGQKIWQRVSVEVDAESEERDAVVGRELLAWFIGDDVNVGKVVESDVKYGGEGPDTEDVETAVRWTTNSVRVDADRTFRADALNVGAGRCPEMEGAVAYQHVEEVVRWAFVDQDGKRVPVGRATRNATYASGCLDVAEEELRKRRNLLTDRAPTGSVSVRLGE